jgi:hypothetical protein
VDIARKRQILSIWAYPRVVVCFLGGFAAPLGAQNALPPPASDRVSVSVSAMQRAVVIDAEELERRVKAALHADPYFYDEHVVERRTHRLAFRTSTRCLYSAQPRL